MNKIITATLILLPAITFAEGGSLSRETKNWLAAVQRPRPEVLREIEKFPNLPEGYAKMAANSIGSRIAYGLETKFADLLTEKECAPEMRVQFLNKISSQAAPDGNTRSFESEVIHIRVVACLEGVNEAQVAAAYQSSEFKLKGADTVISSQNRGSRVCQVTRVAVLGESDYCYNENVFKGEEATYVHSYNDWNRDGVQAPVFYREMIAAVTNTRVNGRAGAAFYTDIFVRGKKLPGLFKGFANSSIAKSQAKSLEVLHAIAKKQSAE